MIVDGIEPRLEQLEHSVASGHFYALAISGRNFGRIVIGGLGDPESLRISLPRTVEQPIPKLGRNPLSHRRTEPVDTNCLPMSNNLIHFFPGIGKG